MKDCNDISILNKFVNKLENQNNDLSNNINEYNIFKGPVWGCILKFENINSEFDTSLLPNGFKDYFNGFIIEFVQE